jgi:phospholipid/cholesterol/gamma-HCH transport system substrate-binding protein
MRPALAAVLAGCLLLAACAGQRPTVVRAVFDDVSDLVPDNGVRIADVPVGYIADISITEDRRALVTMLVDPEVALPAGVSAELRQTGVLGERYVRLVPDPASGGRFPSGGMITDTTEISDLEDLVQAGNQVLAAVAVDKVAGAIEAGGTGLGGRGETLGGLLDDLTAVVDSYETNSADLVRLVDGLDALLADVGPRAELHGRAVGELARVSRVLEEEDARLLDTLADVRDLSRTGTSILEQHRRDLDEFFVRFDALAAELVEREEDLARLPYEVSKHNRNVILGVNSEQAQVILDFIVCGVNDLPGDPVRACTDPPQARPKPPLGRPAGGGS